MNANNCNSLLYFSIFFLISFAQSFAQSSDNYEHIQRSEFPSGFYFGAATSAYQIEGGFLEDGKGLSNWDVFSHIDGKIKNGENGDICDDHYHRYLEDIEIMHSLGVNAYRFSLSWTRILPRGRFGEVNQAGIKLYNDIIDNLLSKGIEPFVTIHHHDFPQELEDRYQAWLSPLMQDDFVYFSKICFENFGDRVKNWISINEPNLFANMAYMWGMYPPGRCSAPLGNCTAGNSDVEPLIAMHNMLLAHAKATKLYRDQFQAKQGGWMGITVSAYMYEPFGNDVYDEEAANRALVFNMCWMLDPIVLGDYPVEMRRLHGDELPKFTAEEKTYLKGSLDFIGVNHYSTLYAKDCLHSNNCDPSDNRAIRGYVSTVGDRNGVLIGPETGMPTFYVVPRGIKENIDYFARRYDNIPMFITENGYASIPAENGLVEDLLNDIKRIEFIKSYLSSLADAIRNGADVRGYFAWSLMDNFEWIQGYSMKFGLYYIDHKTLNRIPKLSAKWYKDFLTKNTSTRSNEVAETLVSELVEYKTSTSMK